jgi:hypothetical protein
MRTHGSYMDTACSENFFSRAGRRTWDVELYKGVDQLCKSKYQGKK